MINFIYNSEIAVVGSTGEESLQHQIQAISSQLQALSSQLTSLQQRVNCIEELNQGNN